MSFIRNGGFERGNTDFWIVDSDGTLELYDVSPKYGTYCGKFTSNGDTHEYILNNDYIDVDSQNLIEISAWIKSVAVRDVRLVLYLYDSDYSYIRHQYSGTYTMDGTYIQLNNQVVLPINTAYIRCGYEIHNSLINEVFYIDGYNGHHVTLESSLTGIVCLHDYGHETATGNTTDDKRDMKQFTTYYADLIVGVVNGTSPTMDVSVYELDYEDNPVLLGSFTRSTAVGRERIVLTTPIGDRMYITYTLGGTSPSYYFRVEVTGKR